MAKALSRDQIFKTSTLVMKSIFVPDWGGNVRYMPMTMTERREIRKNCTTNITNDISGMNESILDAEKFEIYAVIYCCYDPENDNKKLFDMSDYGILSTKMSAGPISTIAQRIMKDSGMSPEAVKSSEEGVAS